MLSLSDVQGIALGLHFNAGDVMSYALKPDVNQMSLYHSRTDKFYSYHFVNGQWKRVKQRDEGSDGTYKLELSNRFMEVDAVLLDDMSNAITSGMSVNGFEYRSDQDLSYNGILKLLSFEHFGRSFVLAAQPTASSVRLFELDQSGNAVVKSVVSDTSARYLSNVSELAVVNTGGKTYIYAASEIENGLTVLSLSSGCQLSHVQDIGVSQSLPVSQISCMKAVDLDAEQFLIVSAAESHSLTVLRVLEGGTLLPTDHIIDDVNLRIAEVRSLATLSYEGRVLVAAAGGDGGLSVFELLPTGQLLFLVSKAGSAQYSFPKIDQMDFLKVNDTAVLMFKDASGHALASVSIDLSRLSAAGSMASNSNDLIIAYEGQNVLDGKAGDDILVDNTGTRFLTGG